MSQGRQLNEVELAAFDTVARVLRLLCAGEGVASLEVRADGRAELLVVNAHGHTAGRIRADLHAECGDKRPSVSFRFLQVVPR